jgi:hypothetical protein
VTAQESESESESEDEAREFWERVDGAAQRESEGMPTAMVFAVACGVFLVIFWGLGALVIFSFAGAVGELSIAWGSVIFFAAGAGAIGVVGCTRRWVWVRWAALVQAVAFTALSVPSWIEAPSSTGVIGLFIAYAALQFLPSSHRWYHPTAPRSRPPFADTLSEIGPNHPE